MYGYLGGAQLPVIRSWGRRGSTGRGTAGGTDSANAGKGVQYGVCTAELGLGGGLPGRLGAGPFPVQSLTLAVMTITRDIWHENQSNLNSTAHTGPLLFLEAKYLYFEKLILQGKLHFMRSPYSKQVLPTL
jgi:hypothetical protein